MLNIVIAIPMGDPATLEMRAKVPNPAMVGPKLDIDWTIAGVDSQDFLSVSPSEAAARWAAPAFAVLQNKLRQKGF